MTKHQCRFHQINTENEFSDDNASDSEADEVTRAAMQLSSGCLIDRGDPSTDPNRSGAMARMDSGALEASDSLSHEPSNPSSVARNAEAHRDAYTFGPNYAVQAQAAVGDAVVNRPGTPPPYRQGNEHPDIAQLQGACGPEQGLHGDSVQYNTAGQTVRPGSNISTQHLHLPAQVSAAGTTFPNRPAQLPPHGQAQNPYYQDGPQPAVTTQLPPGPGEVKHELPLQYQAVQVIPGHEEDPLPPGLAHSASPQSLQTIQGTHPPILLQSLPPQESLLVTPASIGQYYPGYPFGIRWADDIDKFDPATAGYVLPSFRMDHMH